jgi:hypothetical protein
VRINNRLPVAVADYAGALTALESEFRNYADGNGGRGFAEGVGLYVTRLKTGSLISELQALAPFALPFAEHANSILGFAGHLKSGFDYLLGRSPSAERPPNRSIQNLISIAEPVARDGGSVLSVNTIIQGDVHFHLKLPSKDANAAQNVARRVVSTERTPTSAVRERVLLYLFQARSDPRSKAGDRAIIESISESPVRLEFVNEMVKLSVVGGTENPFKLAFIVDVEVGTVGGRPLLYKVLAVHGTMERPDAA